MILKPSAAPYVNKQPVVNAHSLKKATLFFFGLCLALLLPTIATCQTPSGDGCIRVSKKFTTKESPCERCLQAYYTSTEEILVSSGNSTIFYRNIRADRFTSVPLSLSNPHAIVFLPDEKVYYVADTDNNRILALSSLQKGTITRNIHRVAGITLQRPHDIVYDSQTGWLYAINPSTPTIFRFNHSGTSESSLDLSEVLDYSRSLSIINGKVYVSGSSHGRVVEILDFDTAHYKTYRSPEKKREAYAGTWENAGLIINDVEFYHGYWYLSSFFCPSAAGPLQDYNKNKFIRFVSWDDFEAGDWQDLSHLLPDGQVPYYFTAYSEGLALAVFNQERSGIDDNIYIVNTPCSTLPAVIFSLLD